MNLTLTSVDAEALESPWSYAFVRNRGARISRSASRFVKTGGLYGFFISEPQQHLGLKSPSIESFVTSISA